MTTSTGRTMTPEEAAEEIGNVSGYELRRRARQGLVEWTKGPRNKILFTRPQMEAVLESMKQPVRKQTMPDPMKAETPDVFGGTPRSLALARRAG